MMRRRLKVAAVQMDVKQTYVTNRLGQATNLIAEAAAAGAQRVVLSELLSLSTLRRIQRMP